MAPSAERRAEAPGRTERAMARAERVRRRYEERYSGSTAEHLTQRLTDIDIINRGMQFAALLLLCFFPFLIVLNALAGRSTVTGLSHRLSLNHEAARYVNELFASSKSTSSAVSGASYVFFVFGGVAAAAAIQQLYERAFQLENRGMRDMLRRLAWLGVLIGLGLLSSWAGPRLRHTGGPALIGVVGLVALTAFWWFSMWFLLAGRVHARAVFPSALATAVFWLGMQFVFSLTFSDMVISNHREYGPIGVVFSLTSYLVAIGVVIMLGAIVGVVWRERGLSATGAYRRLRPRRHRAPPAAGDGGGAAPT